MAQREDYTATSGQTIFTFSFNIYETSEIAVYQNGTLLTETTDYSVSITSPAPNSGSITLVTGATLDDAIALVQDIPVSRLNDYQTNGDLKAQDIDDDFDRIYELIQGLTGNASGSTTSISDRLVKFSDSEDRSGKTNLIPSPVANQYLTWNSSGELTNSVAPTASVNDTPTVTNVAAVKALDVSSVTSCYMESLSAPEDGGQNHFYYDAASSATPDDQLVIKPDSVTLPAAGRWLALPAGTLGLKDAAVTEAKIGTGAVTTAKVGSQAITPVKMSWIPASAYEGLELSIDAGDTNHDLKVTAGKIADSTGAYVLELTAAITKQIDATWAAGDNAGGFSDQDTLGTSEWNRVYLIGKSTDSTDCDVIFATSLANALADTAAAAAGYDIGRRIDWFYVGPASNLVDFKPNGARKKIWDVMKDAAITPSTTQVNATVQAPPNQLAHLLYAIATSTDADMYGIILRTNQTDTAPSSSAYHVYCDGGDATDNDAGSGSVVVEIRVNGSSEVSHRETDGIPANADLFCLGWEDDLEINND